MSSKDIIVSLLGVPFVANEISVLVGGGGEEGRGLPRQSQILMKTYYFLFIFTIRHTIFYP